MQRHNNDKQNLADLAICRAQHRVQVAQQERDAHAEAHGDESPVENLQWRPADKGDWDPDQVRVSVQGPAFKEVRELAAEVAEGEEQKNGDDEGVAVDEARSTCIYQLCVCSVLLLVKRTYR